VILTCHGRSDLSAVLLGQFVRSFDRSRVLALADRQRGDAGCAGGRPRGDEHFPDLRVHNRITGATFSFCRHRVRAILIPAITYLMESTSDAIRGRIFALLYMTINGVSALPVLLAAALADNIGTASGDRGLGVLPGWRRRRHRRRVARS
jgi:hypothetical protein